MVFLFHLKLILQYFYLLNQIKNQLNSYLYLNNHSLMIYQFLLFYYLLNQIIHLQFQVFLVYFYKLYYNLCFYFFQQKDFYFVVDLVKEKAELTEYVIKQIHSLVLDRSLGNIAVELTHGHIGELHGFKIDLDYLRLGYSAFTQVIGHQLHQA